MAFAQDINNSRPAFPLAFSLITKIILSDSPQVSELKDQDLKPARDFRMKKEQDTILPTFLKGIPQLGGIWKTQKHLCTLETALSISATHHPIDAPRCWFKEIIPFCF